MSVNNASHRSSHHKTAVSDQTTAQDRCLLLPLIMLFNLLKCLTANIISSFFLDLLISCWIHEVV